jgi:hypothetical protein
MSRVTGINGQPYINTDDFVNIDELKNMRFKLYAGIAKSQPIVSEYFSSEDEFLEDQDLKNLIAFAGNPLVPLYPKHMEIMNLDEQDPLRQTYEDLTDIQKRTFLKLSGGSQPFSTLVLKTQYEWQENVTRFPELKEWVEKLPFESTKRVVFYVIEGLNPTVIHADKNLPPHKTHGSEILWFRITPEKSFFIFDRENNVKHNVESTSCFFNERDYHGATPINHMSVSLKIWGTFTKEFREKIGITGSY